MSAAVESSSTVTVECGQDTNTSTVDLVRALYTVGTLPQAQPGGARSATGRREN